MADVKDRDTLPRATLTPGRRSRISAIWLIPMVAAIVAVGIAVNRILKEGPTISIVFTSAEGVEAGKTSIKYKDVTIGQVTAVELSDGFSKVRVTAKIDKHAEGLMVQDAKFWVVEPRVTLSGVSGLGTLLSGNYIGFEAGASPKRERKFTGLEVAPVVKIDEPGRQFVLTADDMGSLTVGSPIYFRRLKVGRVIAHQLTADGKSVTIRGFVNAPYDQYVNAETRFWNASGLDVSVGASGVDVRTESLVALLIGGVAFETPPFATVVEPAAADTTFTLYRDYATAIKRPDTVVRRYVIYTDSADGLAVGAPVRLLGLSAGEVTEVGAALDPKTEQIRPQVVFSFFIERLVARLTREQAGLGKALEDESAADRLKLIRRQVEDLGLRAQILSGNLLTGERYVALAYHPTAPKVTIDWDQDPLELPVIPGGVADIEDRLTGVLDQLEGILKKVDELPLGDVALNLNNAIKTLDRLLKNVDAKTRPQLTRTLERLRGVMATAERVLKDTNATLLGKDAPGQQALRNALQEIAWAARSLRVLADYLERHPEALIRGKARENP